MLPECRSEAIFWRIWSWTYQDIFDSSSSQRSGKREFTAQTQFMKFNCRKRVRPWTFCLEFQMCHQTVLIGWQQRSTGAPDLWSSHRSRESSVSVAEAVTHVGQVGHATSVGSVQGAVVLLDAFGHFLLAVMNLGQLTPSLRDTHTHIHTLQSQRGCFGYYAAWSSLFFDLGSLHLEHLLELNLGFLFKLNEFKVKFIENQLGKRWMLNTIPMPIPMNSVFILYNTVTHQLFGNYLRADTTGE